MCVHMHKHCGYMLSLTIYWTWKHKSVAASHLSVWDGRNPYAAQSPLDYAISNSEIFHLVFIQINSILKFLLPKECPPLCIALHCAYVLWKRSVGMHRDRGVWKVYVWRKYKLFRFWRICMYEILCQHIQLLRGIFQEYLLLFFAGETSWQKEFILNASVCPHYNKKTHKGKKYRHLMNNTSLRLKHHCSKFGLKCTFSSCK